MSVARKAVFRSIIQPITYEEYLAMPETNRRYDILDGVMVMSPAPNFEHQRIALKLATALDSFVEKHGLGVVLVAPIDVLIARKPLKTRQPDILYASFAHTGKTLDDFREMGMLEISPDLTIEILSPGDTRRVLKGKLQDYIKLGVRECWLISPQAATVEVLRIESGSATPVNVFGLGDTLRSETLPGFKMKIDRIFA